MARPILNFPDGQAGIALILLRFSGALVTWPLFETMWPPEASGWPAMLVSSFIALMLVTGTWTRAAALLLVAAVATNLVAWPDDVLLGLASASAAGALALLGPGAYSIDALRFGRRVIRLGPTSPDGGRAGSPQSGFPAAQEHENV